MINMSKKTLNNFCLIISGILIIVFTFYSLFDYVYAFIQPIDTSIESSRDSGTDLYEATKCYNVLPLDISISNGSSAESIHDENTYSSLGLSAGTEITINCDTPMDGLYIVWDSLVPQWEMKIDGETYTFGEYGFIHEYVKLPKQTNSLTIIVPNGSDLGDLGGVYPGGVRISDIYAFPDDNLPSYVQLWEPPTENADILVISTHADDEDIFFGSVSPIYAGERGLDVQVVYFVQHWETEKIREHEKITGLWLAGVKNYPILGDFPDAWSTSYEEAATLINPDDAISYITDSIRCTHPQVIVTHDIDGDYGHGQHLLVVQSTITAIDLANDSTYNPESVEKYGTWETSKLYLHLYNADQYDGEYVKLDLRSPLDNFDGKRGIDVARQAYLCHQSQQWCDFTIDDYGPRNISAFVLYKSNVGSDVNNDDLMENLISYKEQQAAIEAERLAAEQASASANDASVSGNAASVSSNSADINDRSSHPVINTFKAVFEGIIAILFTLVSVLMILEEKKLIIKKSKNKLKRRKK